MDQSTANYTSSQNLFKDDLFLMYNKANLTKMFHEKSLPLPESLDHEDYYHARILLLHTELKNRHVHSRTPLGKISDPIPKT